MGDGPFRIGTVAKLVGVPAATIRTWERRYAVVEPSRTSGRDRLYSAEDVERLQRIAFLRRRGERVADLATLDIEALAARQSRYEAPEPAGPAEVRVVAVMPHLPSIDGITPDGRAHVEIIASGAAVSDVAEPIDADVALVDLSALGADPAATVRSLRRAWSVGAVLVLYGFSNRRVLGALGADGVRTIRVPLRDDELRDAVVDLALSRIGDEPVDGQAEARPEPRYDLSELRRLMGLSNTLTCECPNHLAAILISLQQFEDYSRGCESTSPEDAALHRSLADGTGQARSIMEQLLARVCAQEGIDIGG